MRISVAAALLLVVPSLASAAPSDRLRVDGVPLLNARAVDVDASRDQLLEWARSALTTRDVIDADPTLARASDLVIQAFRFGDARVLRAVAVLDGVPVEGADRRLTVDRTRGARFFAGTPLKTSGAFVLSPEEAVAVGALSARGAVFTDVTVENTAALAHRVYLARGDHVVATWRVRIPTLRITDAIDVWVDAETGAILKERRVALALDGGIDDGGIDDAGTTDAGPDDGGPGDAGAVDAGEVDAGDDTDAGTPLVDAGSLPPAPTAARIYQWWPNPAGITPLDLVDFELQGLIDANIGGPLLGGHFETRNCCKKYVCLDGSTECGLNDPTESRCANADDDDPLTSTISVEIPTSFLNLPTSDFEILYAKSVFCAELPRARSRPASGGDPAGFYESPVDQPRFPNAILGLASEEDAFAELQAYALTSTFFAHVRDTIDDDTFCLRDLSMACDATGAPVKDEHGRPVLPFRITVNALRPAIDVENIFLQLLSPGGKGRTPGNPIEVNEYARETQAVFLPALSSGPINIPPELAVIGEIFTREFDSTIYFQGERDFAYDGSIVFHEFAHAVIHTYKPNLEQYGHDAQGGHAMPGALNEAFADYFSASFSGDPAIAQYGSAGAVGGETGLRDLAASKKCPDDIAGEVHDDSYPFSTALWAIRSTVVATVGASAVPTYDRLLWQAVSSADDDETFARMAERVLDGVEAEFGASVRATAAGVFASRAVIDCARVFPLSLVSSSGAVSTQTKARLQMPTPAQLGLASLAPAAVQFRVEVPKGTAGFRVRWDQASLIDASFGGEPVQLSVLAFEDDAPVEWRYSGANANYPTPFKQSGTQIVFNPEPPPSRADIGDPARPFFNVEVAVDPCAKKTFHVVLINIEGATPVLSNIGVELLPGSNVPECEVVDAGGDGDGDGDGDGPDEPPVCGCENSQTDGGRTPVTALAVLVLLVSRVRRRR